MELVSELVLDHPAEGGEDASERDRKGDAILMHFETTSDTLAVDDE